MRKKVFRLPIAFLLILLLCFSTIPAWADVSVLAKPEQVVLSLTGDPAEMAVTWCDAADSSGRIVVYGTDSGLSGAYTIAADTTAAGSGLKYYEATMKRLAPGLKYYYQVGTPGNMSDIRSFTTEDRDDSRNGYEFIYLGDVQYDKSMEADFDQWKSLVEKAYEDNPSAAFFLQGGDLVNYGQNPAEWQALLTRAESTFSQVPLLSVAGNHESNDKSGKPELWSQIFDLPKNGPAGFEEEFYSFEYGDSHIVCLNSNILSNEQLDAGTMTKSDFDTIKKWIADDLGGSTKKWKIAVLHHPPYVVVADSVSAKVLNEWVPIFEDNGVSLVLCGHQHIYMRTEPMFDRLQNNTSGITYIMGNSGSKFYPAADLDYDAKMISDTSTYQTVKVADSSIEVKTCDLSGVEMDAVTIAKPTAAGNTISLNYNASVAKVTAPAAATSGSSVKVEISGLSSGKNVYSVTAEDKNGRSYPAATIKSNESYSFVMPNRSVMVEVLFEDGGNVGPGGDGACYTYSTNTNDDPIWSFNVDSSGISAEDKTKIRAGSTVTVTVTRNSEALTAYLENIIVKNGSKEVPVTPVSTSAGKSGKYQFTMPEGNVTISPQVSYEDLTVYARESSSGPYTIKGTLSREKMERLSRKSGYYSGYDRYPTAVAGKAEKYVTLKELLRSCEIELTTSSSITLTAMDGASETFAYDDLYGKTRYCYPNIDTGSSSGKEAIEPMLIVKGYQSRCFNLPSGKSIADMTSDTMMAYRFAYGQTEEEFNDGKASAKYATVGDFMKWINSIKISGFKTATEKKPEEPGSGVAVDTEVAISKEGLAVVTLEESVIKKSLKAALEGAKGESAVPKLNISVASEAGIKAAEIRIPKAAMKELISPDRLLVMISTPFGNVRLDSEVLKEIKKQSLNQDIIIEIVPVEKDKLGNKDSGRELTGDNVRIDITSNNKKLTEFGGGKVVIEIPFIPDPSRKVNGYYVVWFADNGSIQRMPGSFCDKENKVMKFETAHLSTFGIAYTTNTAVNLFEDVKEGSWYAPYATFVTEKGYFQGIGEKTFGPDAAMTRAMLVTVLGRANNVNTGGYQSSAFHDAALSSWYGGYAQWAYENGIVSGVSTGRFEPNQAVTREQLAAILTNYSQWKNDSKEAQQKPGGTSDIKLSYKDADRISAWADSGVKFCVMKGWLSGYPDGNFKPGKSASRAEVAKLLSSVCE